MPLTYSRPLLFGVVIDLEKEGVIHGRNIFSSPVIRGSYRSDVREMMKDDEVVFRPLLFGVVIDLKELITMQLDFKILVPCYSG